MCPTIETSNRLRGDFGKAIAFGAVVLAAAMPARAETVVWPAESLLLGSSGIQYDVLTHTALYAGVEYHQASDSLHWSLRSAETPVAPRFWAEYYSQSYTTFESVLDITLQTWNAAEGFGTVNLNAGTDGRVGEGSVWATLDITVPQLNLHHTVLGSGNPQWNQYVNETLGWQFNGAGLRTLDIFLDYKVSGVCANPPSTEPCARLDVAGFTLGAFRTAAAVPEPAAAYLMAPALIAVAWAARKAGRCSLASKL